MANKKKFSRDEVFSIILKTLVALVLLLFIVCVVKTCVDCRNMNKVTLIKKTGYDPERERWDKIPEVEPPYTPEELDSLPDAVSLEHLFPPIGNQNPYGTCVAWAAGYNMKTALNAIDNHWTPEQLANPANQTSPKDLYLGISRDYKNLSGPCNGSIYSAAAEVLLEKGVASMAEVPYSNLGMCRGSFTGDTANRIAHFEHVVSGGQKPNIQQLKAYLKDTIPLLFAAHVGNSFATWRSDGVFDLHDSGAQEGHAMVLVGYDDSKHAFRIRNTWGTSWGDNGSAWVDYDFFMNDFCKEVCIMRNSSEPTTPPVASSR